MYRQLIFILLLICGLAGPAFAQSSGLTGSFSRLGFGPRGMAMGNAVTSTTAEGIYHYYNPALAAYASDKKQIDLSVAAMSFDRSLNMADATFRLPPTGGVAVSIINANVGNIDGRSASGYSTGTFSTQEYQISAAMAQQFSNKFAAGVAIKYYIANYYSGIPNAKTIAVDFGVLYKISPRLNIAAAVHDLLASYRWNSGSYYGDDGAAKNDKFPVRTRFGVSYQATDKWLISLDAGRMIHSLKSSNNLHIGSSYDIHKRITVRVGWQVENLSDFSHSSQGSAGFSVHLPFDLLSPSIDYAFIQEPNNVSFMHLFGLRLNL